MSEWQPIEAAEFGVWVLAWNPIWARPYPAVRNGDGGAVNVDWGHDGWQANATHFMPLPEPPSQENRCSHCGFWHVGQGK